MTEAPHCLIAVQNTGCLPSLSVLSDVPLCRFKVERFMQWVFGLSAATLFVPVVFHSANTQDVTDALPSAGAPPQGSPPRQLCLACMPEPCPGSMTRVWPSRDTLEARFYVSHWPYRGAVIAGCALPDSFLDIVGMLLLGCPCSSMSQDRHQHVCPDMLMHACVRASRCSCPCPLHI